ncbi:16674_t:CDS:2 [Cetraspora pellucida]|uniref:16674_t:CDS:1 n=1 Tax=Cetraspora pellucida TaxID=1433469 RepID=A0A9N8YZU5_9GLOM|nr:16674_t:CDS:2 [Cetraspora pellucida]
MPQNLSLLDRYPKYMDDFYESKGKIFYDEDIRLTLPPSPVKT